MGKNKAQWRSDVVDTSESRRDCGRALEDVPSFRKDRSLSYCWMGTSPFELPFGLFFRLSSGRLFDFLRRREEKILFGQRCSSGTIETATKERGFPRSQWEFFISVCSLPKCWLATTKPMKLFSAPFPPPSGIPHSPLIASIWIPVSKDLRGLKDPRTRHSQPISTNS